MPSFSNLITKLTDIGFYYTKNPRHATFNFNQESQSLYRNQPRLPFEFYIDIGLNNVGSAGTYFSQFFNNPSWTQVQPLVKSIEMPSFKIQTEALNQYNRKRLSQTRIDFEPVKVVFHDVADGKTLKFWEMYYRYYFQDGNEPGRNMPKLAISKTGATSATEFLKNITPSFNPNILNLPSSIKNVISGIKPSDKPFTNNNGEKAKLEDIIENTLENQKFGFNLEQVQGQRNLIESINIFQVHGGRFNQVTLVNPRISTFTHDTLSYSVGDKTLELTFTFEYEYAYYTIQNLKLGGTEFSNNSSMEQFEHGEFLELPALAFNARLLDFIESNNPLLNTGNPILDRIGKNVQSSLGSVTGAFASKAVRRVTSSALDGLANISPTPYHPTPPASIATRPFASVPSVNSAAYQDVSRIVSNLF